MEVTRTQKAEGVNISHRPVNVLFIDIALNIGGEERVLQTVLNNADKAVLQPIIAVLGEKGPIAKELEKTGIKIYDQFISRNYDPRGVGLLAQISRQENADIIYCPNMPMPMIYGWLTKKRSHGSKLVVAFHTMGNTRHPGWRNRVTSFMGRSADRFVAVSKGQKEYYVQNHHIPRDKIEVIYVGIDTERFMACKYDNSVRVELGIPDSNKVVGIIAVLRAQKNHALFLKMAKSVSLKRKDVIFLIAGDGPERKMLETMTEEMGLTNIVKFLGSRPDAPEVIHSFDISVLTSSYETMPQSLQESMSMEVPVVSTNVGCIADEMVIDGVTGYITPEGNVDALTEKVIYLLDNPKTAKEMGKAGRKHVEEYFTKSKMVKHFEDFFVKLSEQHNMR